MLKIGVPARFSDLSNRNFEAGAWNGPVSEHLREPHAAKTRAQHGAKRLLHSTAITVRLPVLDPVRGIGDAHYPHYMSSKKGNRENLYFRNILLFQGRRRIPEKRFC